MTDKKERYADFCKQNPVQIYAQPWWMDAVCGPENWDVWLYDGGGAVSAAMPYYFEQRGAQGQYRYITKSPLTQIAGVQFAYPPGQKLAARQAYEEKILLHAADHIDSLGLAVYEQQYPYTLTTCLPLLWRGFSAVPRYTYVIENAANMDVVHANYTANYRNTVKKGRANVACFAPIAQDRFYDEHEKVFARQGLPCPFSRGLWYKVYSACAAHNAGEIVAAQDGAGHVLSLAFFVWDAVSVNLLLGGSMPEYASLQTYAALIDYGISLAGKKGLAFDFEGSMIQRINHAFREYGAQPKLYFRIRKIFNPEIVRQEAEQQIAALQRERE